MHGPRPIRIPIPGKLPALPAGHVTANASRLGSSQVPAAEPHRLDSDQRNVPAL